MSRLLKRTDVRLGMVCAAGATVLGLGAFVLGGSSQPDRPLGPTLAIAVVPPVEREVLPGETMEVGVLNNGFDRAMLDRLPAPEIPDTNPGPAWAGLPMPWLDEPPARPAAPVVVQVIEKPAPRPDPLADGSRAFGFDQPAPDYAAERRLRSEQREALPAKDSAADTPSTNPNIDVLPIKYSPQ